MRFHYPSRTLISLAPGCFIHKNHESIKIVQNNTIFHLRDFSLISDDLLCFVKAVSFLSYREGKPIEQIPGIHQLW